jgi:hypothetical protein
MQIHSQRLVIIFALVISLVVTGILFVLAQRNPSEAYYALTDTGTEMKLDYYRTPDFLPQAETPSDKYTLLFFSATWDAYSLRLSDMLRGQLALRNDIQIVELDINEYAGVALSLQVKQPPVVILLDMQGLELDRIVTSTQAQLDKLISLLPN